MIWTVLSILSLLFFFYIHFIFILFHFSFFLFNFILFMAHLSNSLLLSVFVILIINSFLSKTMYFMHLSMLSLRGGEEGRGGGGKGPRAYVEHLTSIAFPTRRNIKNPHFQKVSKLLLSPIVGPRVRTFAFFVWRNGTKSDCRMCSSMRRPLWNWGGMA